MPAPELDSRILDEVIARVGRDDYPAWAAALAGAGNCAHPVRLAGRVTASDPSTGEQTVAFTTASRPDRVLLKACGTRRATRCHACATVYRGDARALILAGLLGGKGIDPAVTEHPFVFVTLTAPSFGTVHTPTGPEHPTCQPARPSGRCRHGRPRCCRLTHEPHDPATGMPLCVDCYDTEGAVIWNARAGELWRRTTIAWRRQLAASAASTTRDLARRQTLAFVKVAEYQQRGLVHFHALIRLDPAASHRPLAAETLAAAITATLPRVTVTNPHRADDPIRWGPQCAVVALPSAERRAVAGYLAKYATKSVDTGGALDRRLHHGDLSNYPIPDHLRRMAETAWNLGADPTLGTLNLRHWAHTLGYRGHWLTKGRTWSTTLTRLRQDRYTWQLTRHPDPETDNRFGLRVGEWTYQGSGHTTDGDAWLADMANRTRQLRRRIAWEER